MKIIIVKDYAEMSKLGAEIIANKIKENDHAFLGLATGSSPIGTYQNLVKMYNDGEISFKNITTYNLDEYCGINRSHPQSYYYFMHEHLFNHVNIKESHLPDGTNPDSDAECARYEALIDSMGGIDLQLLGLGHNGHIGFNEPADHFPKCTNCVDLQESTIEANKRFFESIDDVPRQAYTMGIGTIMKAKKIVIIVNGEGKADIVNKAFFGPVTPQVPASILQLHPDVSLVADAAALSKSPSAPFR